MKQNGQVFSLDFLLSIVLVLLAVGIIMQFLELKTYETKEFSQQQELERIGNTAAELLVSNPAIVCELKDVAGNTIGTLQNCLATTPSLLKKENLGIPSSYSCNISASGTGVVINSDECNSILDSSTQPNIFVSTRKIVFQQAGRQVQKSELQNCINGAGCSLKNGEITIKVWKP